MEPWPKGCEGLGTLAHPATSSTHNDAIELMAISPTTYPHTHPIRSREHPITFQRWRWRVVVVLVLLVAVGFGVAGPYGRSKQANSKNIHGFSSTATNALFPGGEGWRADAPKSTKKR